MSLSILTNTASLRAQRDLSQHSQALGRTFERLSSGLRIVRASDDPGGLAVAEKFRAEAALMGVAVRNANTGIAQVSVVDSALNEIGNVLVRMAELAQQSANGTLTTAERSALESEFVALGSEIARVAAVTEFNDQALLLNSSDTTIQVGTDSTSNSQITIQAVTGTLAALGLGPGTTAQLTYSINDTTTAGAQAAATTALSAVQDAISTNTVSRGTVGAAESRLTSAVSMLESQRENFLSAESAIRDADVAFEAANLIRLQILQQGATAVLAQANQQPALALELLG